MSEWLGKIDATTELEDVITRPSSFNPYPEHADGGIEVWSISNPTVNPLYTIRYPKIDAGCRVVLPISYEEPVDKRELPELLEGSEINGGYQDVEAADPENWIPLADFWGGLAVGMASEYLVQEGHKKGAGERVAELIVANASDLYSGDYVSPEPRAFVRHAINAAQQEILEGRPEAGYAIATNLFRGFMRGHGDYRVSNESTMEWVTSGLPSLLFPNFTDSWNRKLNPHRISTVAHPYEIGNSAARIVTSNLSGLAVDSWMENGSPDHPNAVVEKVAILQKQITKGIITAEADLKVRLDEATRRFHEATVDEQGYLRWEIPRPLGKYVMGIISSAD